MTTFIIRKFFNIRGALHLAVVVFVSVRARQNQNWLWQCPNSNCQGAPESGNNDAITEKRKSILDSGSKVGALVS